MKKVPPMTLLVDEFRNEIKKHYPGFVGRIQISPQNGNILLEEDNCVYKNLETGVIHTDLHGKK